jgi:hypothetical protein
MASVFTQGVYSKTTANRIGWGATLGADGSLTTVTGPELIPSAVTPNGAVSANPSSLALVNGGLGSLWFKSSGTGNTGWIQIPTANGGSFGDDVPLYFGNDQDGYLEYFSGINTFYVGTTDHVQSTVAIPAVPMIVKTGDRDVSGAIAGAGSALLYLTSGDTDCTNAGGTAGNTGDVYLTSGASTSTLGTSGLTGSLIVKSGNSDDDSSGSVGITSGNSKLSSGNVSILTGISTNGASGNIIIQTLSGSGSTNNGYILLRADGNSRVELASVVQMDYQVCFRGMAYNTPISGANVLIGSTTTTEIITPAGALLALTVTLPDVSAVSLAMTGSTVTVVITQAITTLTMAGLGGAKVTGALGATTGYQAQTFRYSHTGTTWYRVA